MMRWNPLSHGLCAKRFTTSTTSQAPAKKSNWALWIGAPLGAAGLASLYAYSTRPASSTAKATAKEYNPFLTGQWKNATLKEIVQLNHNVKNFRFDMGTSDMGLPIAAHVAVKYQTEGMEKPIIRPYTPVVSEKSIKEGTLDLVVKVYPNGKMSTHIDNLKVGDTLAIKGPNLKYAYQPNTENHLGLIAGGSGLTPCLQLLQKVATDPSDKTKVDLLFANETEGDIFLKKELDAYAAMKPDQIKIHYVLSKPPKGWTGLSGFVNDSMIKKFMPSPSKGKVFVCGPPPMLAAIAGPKAPDWTQGEVGGALKTLGYATTDIFKF